MALRNPQHFRSVSAFSPICSPMNCPWGEKALGGYLGADRQRWEEHDSCVLIRRADRALPLLVDQGAADDFLEVQLRTPLLEAACGDPESAQDRSRSGRSGRAPGLSSLTSARGQDRH